MGRLVTLITGQWADMSFEEICATAQKMGYDGLEIACWGNHLDINRAYEDDAYVQEIKDTLIQPSVQGYRNTCNRSVRR